MEIKVVGSDIIGFSKNTIVLNVVRPKEANALIVLIVVEKMLGYKLIGNNGSAGSVWEFKREEAFRY